MIGITDAINDVVKGEEESFVLAQNEKSQESMRVQAYAIKSKLPETFKDILGITKIEENGLFYVRLYRRPTSEVYVRDKETGKIILKQRSVLDKAENRRQIELMREEGYADIDIEKVLLGEDVRLPKKKVEKEELLETRGIDSKPEKVLTEKEEMKKMKGEENDE